MFNRKSIIGGSIVAAAAVIALTVTNATASSTTPTRTAGQVVAQLQAAGLPVANVTEVTSETDLNHLLGRPGGYTSKATFTDSTIHELEAEPGSVIAGGSVEAYPDHAAAQARVEYITKMLKAMPAFGTEYDYVIGNTVLRVSSLLTPEQAAAYENAAK